MLIIYIHVSHWLFQINKLILTLTLTTWQGFYKHLIRVNQYYHLSNLPLNISFYLCIFKIFIYFFIWKKYIYTSSSSHLAPKAAALHMAFSGHWFMFSIIADSIYCFMYLIYCSKLYDEVIIKKCCKENQILLIIIIICNSFSC